MDAFRSTDRSRILACLTDDVEWEIPGVFHVRGKEEFDKRIVDENFVGSPAIHVTRLTEADDVVVAEGSVRTRRQDGRYLNLAFCDVFEMQDAKVRRLISYLMDTKEPDGNGELANESAGNGRLTNQSETGAIAPAPPLR